ncbi:MAG: SDR family NAD(P)-dependent oxidoreductase, partial [Cyanobacteria bacterium P01_F01_bin.150]
MANLFELLNRLIQLNIKVKLDSGNLKINSPKGALTAELRKEIAENKNEIIRFLQQTSKQETIVDLVPVERPEKIPLSFSQERLWSMCQLVPNNGIYNITTVIEIQGNLNLDRLQISIKKIGQRHEVLRTNFKVEQGIPSQTITPHFNPELTFIDSSDSDNECQRDVIEQYLEQDAYKEFDLSHECLLRFKVIRIASSRTILFITAHHLIIDVLSLNLLVSEIGKNYELLEQGSSLTVPKLPIQYADFVIAQKQRWHGDLIGEGLKYWSRKLSSTPPPLKLPIDHPRPSIPSFQGGTYFFELSISQFSLIKTFSSQNNTTVFVTLLTAFKVLLSQWSGQRDIIVGTPTSGKDDPKLDPLIGLFADLLMLRTDLFGNPRLIDLLSMIKENISEAKACQNIPLSKVLEVIEPNLLQTPLFQVVFGFIGSQPETTTIHDLKFTPISEAARAPTDMDLFFTLADVGGKLQGLLIYNQDIFESDTIAAFADSFYSIIQQLIDTPEKKISEFTLLRRLEEYRKNLIFQDKELVSLEHVIKECPGIIDAHVMKRESSLIAYIVPANSFSKDNLSSYLRTHWNTIQLPDIYVQISTLPLTPSGYIDERLLCRLNVIDADLIQNWQDTILTHEGVEQANIIVEPHVQSIKPLHLKAILPKNTAKSSNLALVSKVEEGIYTASDSPTTDFKTVEAPSLKSASVQLAICNGGKLEGDAQIPKTLGKILQHMARIFPTQELVYIQNNGTSIVQTFSELLEDAQRILKGLRDLGLKPQDKIIFQLSKNEDIIPAFWGCILGGFIPVIMMPPPSYVQADIKIEKFIHVFNLLEKPLIITSEGFSSNLTYLQGQYSSLGIQFTCIEHLRNNLLDRDIYPTDDQDVALFSLTSGSTGNPKCVMLTHRNLISRAQGVSFLCQHTHENIILNWLPLDHIGSISDWHIKPILLGCRLIYVQTDLVLGRSLKWLDLVDEYRVTNSWAPNFAYNLINDALDKAPSQTWDLSCLQSLLTSGEAISEKTISNFIENLHQYGLRKTVFQPVFGMAETGSGITYYQATEEHPIRCYGLDSLSADKRLAFVAPDDHNASKFLALGTVIPGVSVRIVNVSNPNEVLQTNQVGLIQVKGDAVFTGYYQNPTANAEAFQRTGWFTTGDLGSICDRNLVVTGRIKDTIIINGNNYYGHEIEAIVEKVAGVEVSYTAACAVVDDGQERLAVFFVASHPDHSALKPLLDQIREAIATSFHINPGFLIPVEKTSIPKTSIGKIQRTKLSQRFAAGDFDSIVKAVDLLLENENTIPDWFYRRVWREKRFDTHRAFSQLPTSLLQSAQNGATLIFVDHLGLGAYLTHELRKEGGLCIEVLIGTDFIQHDAERFSIRPDSKEHYQQLSAAIADHNISHVIHLWNYAHYTGEANDLDELEQSQKLGVISLLYLAQTLTHLVPRSLPQSTSVDRSIYVLFVSSYSQYVEPNDVVAYEKSTVLGLLKTIPQEIPQLKCCHLDCSTESLENLGEYLLRNLCVCSNVSSLAYRRDRCFIPILEQANLPQQPEQELPFKPGGMYLISGGLGGISVEVSRYLLDSYQVKLILIGRDPLPERSTWDEHIKQNSKLAEKIRSYQMLEQMGGSIVYEAVDVCDRDRLQDLVEQYETQWNTSLSGVIHLAGVYQEQLLNRATDNTLLSTIKPKLFGVWTLQTLVATRPEAVFVNFSSIAGLFGGPMVGEYAAANSFMENFSEFQNLQKDGKYYCFTWSVWSGVGMSHGYQRTDRIRASGYYTISAVQGIQSLIAGLSRYSAPFLIGLDGGKQPIRRFMAKSEPLNQLTAYIQMRTSGQGPCQSLSIRPLVDRFGHQSSCQLLYVSDEALSHPVHFITQGEIVEPRTETEHILLEQWQKQLGKAEISL